MQKLLHNQRPLYLLPGQSSIYRPQSEGRGWHEEAAKRKGRHLKAWARGPSPQELREPWVGDSLPLTEKKTSFYQLGNQVAWIPLSLQQRDTFTHTG